MNPQRKTQEAILRLYIHEIDLWATHRIMFSKKSGQTRLLSSSGFLYLRMKEILTETAVAMKEIDCGKKEYEVW